MCVNFNARRATSSPSRTEQQQQGWGWGRDMGEHANVLVLPLACCVMDGDLFGTAPQ